MAEETHQYCNSLWLFTSSAMDPTPQIFLMWTDTKRSLCRNSQMIWTRWRIWRTNLNYSSSRIAEVKKKDIWRFLEHILLHSVCFNFTTMMDCSSTWQGWRNQRLHQTTLLLYCRKTKIFLLVTTASQDIGKMFVKNGSCILKWKSYSKTIEVFFNSLFSCQILAES